jgi:hypothetical protein
MDNTYLTRRDQIVKLLLSHGTDPNSFVSKAARGEQGDGGLSALYFLRAPLPLNLEPN